MQSTRRSRPWGHLGSGLTFSTPYGLLGFLWGLLSGQAGLGALWLLFTVVNRLVQASSVLLVLGDPEWEVHTLMYPLRDLLGSALWASSYFGENFYYRGKVYRLEEGGVVELPDEVAG